MKIIFTGSNYWKINNPIGEITGDFKLIDGYRWIKATKSWAAKSKLFPCPKFYQELNKGDIEAQGLNV